MRLFANSVAFQHTSGKAGKRRVSRSFRDTAAGEPKVNGHIALVPNNALGWIPIDEPCSVHRALVEEGEFPKYSLFQPPLLFVGGDFLVGKIDMKTRTNRLAALLFTVMTARRDSVADTLQQRL